MTKTTADSKSQRTSSGEEVQGNKMFLTVEDLILGKIDEGKVIGETNTHTLFSSLSHQCIIFYTLPIINTNSFAAAVTTIHL